MLWRLADLPLEDAAHDAIDDGRNELFVDQAIAERMTNGSGSLS